MKTIEIHITTYGYITRDTDCRVHFSKDDAIRFAADLAAHLTARERKNYTIYTEAYSVRVPDDYTVTTAEKLDRDLCGGDVESPDFDPCTAQYTSPQLYFIRTI